MLMSALPRYRTFKSENFQLIQRICSRQSSAIKQMVLLEKIFSWRQIALPNRVEFCNKTTVDREILHRVLARKRDDARRGSSVDFKEETDILRNGHSRNEGQKTRAERHEMIV
jgi:hypothetical protein